MTPCFQPRVLVIGPELILQWTESTARGLESLGCTVQVRFYNQSGPRQGIKGLRRFVSRRMGFVLPAIPQTLANQYGAWVAARMNRAIV
ncbi:MAG: hypothetical protein EPO64_12835, partial [Nitrospirae bacterium]